MRIEVTNIYDGADFDIEPVCGTEDVRLLEFYNLLNDDDIMDLKGYHFDLVNDDA